MSYYFSVNFGKNFPGGLHCSVYMQRLARFAVAIQVPRKTGSMIEDFISFQVFTAYVS
jgi:hypothetical protein